MSWLWSDNNAAAKAVTNVENTSNITSVSNIDNTITQINEQRKNLDNVIKILDSIIEVISNYSTENEMLQELKTLSCINGECFSELYTNTNKILNELSKLDIESFTVLFNKMIKNNITKIINTKLECIEEFSTDNFEEIKFTLNKILKKMEKFSNNYKHIQSEKYNTQCDDKKIIYNFYKKKLLAIISNLTVKDFSYEIINELLNEDDINDTHITIMKKYIEYFKEK